MTRAEFIADQRDYLAGVIALASAKARRVFTGPFEDSKAFGAVIMGLADTAEEVLGKLYDAANKPVPPLANGKPPLAPQVAPVPAKAVAPPVKMAAKP